MKRMKQPITGDGTLALALALSLLLHAAFLSIRPPQSPGEISTDPMVPLEVATGPAVAPQVAAWAPDLPLEAPEPPGDAAPLNRHGLIKKYLTRVRNEIEGNKFYPPGKKDSRMIGNAEIGFCITANGSFEHIRVLRSSGNPRLDGTAQKAVAHTSGKVRRPVATGERRIRTSVVVKYQYGL